MSGFSTDAPLAVDLCCGVGGWSDGLQAEGYFCVGFDIERHVYGEHRYPGQLVIQDITTLHGSQFRDAALIVGSPPCQRYSYMAMPFSRGKAQAAAIRADTTGQMLADLNRLFDACFRIQREACEAAGRHIPMVVENVRGAGPWVGRSRWNFGSFHLWGDVPALMPQTVRARKNGELGGGSWFAIGSPGQTVTNVNPVNMQSHGRKIGGMKWYHPDDPRHVPGQGFNTLADRLVHSGSTKLPGFRFDGSGRSFQTAAVEREDGLKEPGGTRWFNDGPRTPDSMASMGSKSPRRKEASALIAKIPFPLAQWIAATYHPGRRAA